MLYWFLNAATKRIFHGAARYWRGDEAGLVVYWRLADSSQSSSTVQTLGCAGPRIYWTLAIIVRNDSDGSVSGRGSYLLSKSPAVMPTGSQLVSASQGRLLAFARSRRARKAEAEDLVSKTRCRILERDQTISRAQPASKQFLFTIRDTN